MVVEIRPKVTEEQLGAVNSVIADRKRNFEVFYEDEGGLVNLLLSLLKKHNIETAYDAYRYSNYIMENLYQRYMLENQNYIEEHITQEQIDELNEDGYISFEFKALSNNDCKRIINLELFKIKLSDISGYFGWMPDFLDYGINWITDIRFMIKAIYIGGNYERLINLIDTNIIKFKNLSKRIDKMSDEEFIYNSRENVMLIYQHMLNFGKNLLLFGLNRENEINNDSDYYIIDDMMDYIDNYKNGEDVSPLGREIYHLFKTGDIVSYSELVNKLPNSPFKRRVAKFLDRIEFNAMYIVNKKDSSMTFTDIDTGDTILELEFIRANQMDVDFKLEDDNMRFNYDNCHIL